MAAQKERLHYFDMLKGIAIFMVVMGHVIAFCVRGIDKAAIFKFIGEIHMPLFFFVSGWLTWRSGRKPTLVKRGLQLIVPMVVCSSLWVFYFPHSGLESPLDSTFSGLWADRWKNGYWFTLVLFEIVAVYAIVRPLLNRCRSVWTELVVWIVSFFALYGLDVVSRGTDVNAWLSLNIVVTFFLVFAFGVLASRHSEAFNRLVRNQTVFTLAILLGAVALYMKCWYWEFPFLQYALSLMALAVLLHICLAVVGVGIVRPWSIAAFEGASPKPFASMWTYLGRKSLSIYLLHYFFLFPLGGMRDILLSMHVAFLPLLVFSAIVAAAIISVVLCVERMLQPSALLSWFLCGQLPEYISKRINI